MFYALITSMIILFSSSVAKIFTEPSCYLNLLCSSEIQIICQLFFIVIHWSLLICLVNINVWSRKNRLLFLSGFKRNRNFRPLEIIYQVIWLFVIFWLTLIEIFFPLSALVMIYVIITWLIITSYRLVRFKEVDTVFAATFAVKDKLPFYEENERNKLSGDVKIDIQY